MDLIHNVTFRITGGAWAGIYRVLARDERLGQLAVARLDLETVTPRGGRQRLPVRKNPLQPRAQRHVAAIEWIPFKALEEARETHALDIIEIRRGAHKYRAPSGRTAEIFRSRLVAMEELLDHAKVQTSIVKHRSWSVLAASAMARSGHGRTLVYKLISALCREGFDRASLIPDLARCGGANKPRPVDGDGRKKAGRKTSAQRIARATGGIEPDVQPGMSSVWRALILAADGDIPSPKPRVSVRVQTILSTRFATSYTVGPDGKLKPQLGPIHTYPTKEQIRRVLLTAVPELDKIKRATTPTHFATSVRGRRGKSVQGVAGPGHTYAIDSTIGDLYLRSSINPSWVLGRPVVYVLVDVWSTAVVGFHVCLTGPKWEMARLSIFNACISPAVLGRLWGFTPFYQLDPLPSLCAILLCDRGEYLSQAASQDSLKCKLSMSYAPPYRGDLKGDVEVLHRIAKDATWTFVPGAIDARKKELELRRFDPWRSAFTLGEFTNFLQVLFGSYNLSADRTNRLDASMIADGVFPSPAGLWSWGHKVGIGFRRADDQDHIINSWLPHGSARVTSKGVMWASRTYGCEQVTEQEWTTLARAKGAFDISTRVYPGSVRHIWTPDFGGQGMLELELMDESNADGSLSLDEILDVNEIRRMSRPQAEHTRRQTELSARQEILRIKEAAVARTAAATGKRHEAPTMAQARALELAACSPAALPQLSAGISRPTEAKAPFDPAEDLYAEQMRKILAGEEVGE